jgi:hypothetical protein
VINKTISIRKATPYPSAITFGEIFVLNALLLRFFNCSETPSEGTERKGTGSVSSIESIGKGWRGVKVAEIKQ